MKFTAKLFAILVLTSLFGGSCSKLEILSEEVNLILDTDLLATPLTLQFIDANPDNRNLPSNISIKVIGPDAGLVFSVLGERKISTEEGNIVSLGIKKTAAASPEAPLEFSLVINAPGFLETVYPVLIEDMHRIRFETVNLIRPDSPPKGISAVSASFRSNKSGTLQEYIVGTDLDNNKREKVELVIPPNTRLFDENGNELRGTVQAVLVHYDNRQASSFICSPGGFMVNNARDMDGNALGKGALVSAGLVSIEMYVNKIRVRSSSKPILINMEINREMVNPETGRSVLKGDVIPVWSLSEETGEWQMTSKSMIERIDRKLVAQTYIKEFTHLNWDWWRERCRSNIVVRTNIPFERSGKRYLTVLFRSYRWKHIYWEWPVELQYRSLYDGEDLDFKVFRFEDLDRAYKLRVYENIYELSERNPVAESEFFYLSCNSMEIDLGGSIEPEPSVITTNMEVSAICRENLELRPTMNIYFRLSDSPRDFYSDFARLEGGKGSTNVLKKGGKYDFYLAYGPIKRRIKNIVIPAENQLVPINNSETGLEDILEFEYLDEQTLELRLLNIQLSEISCNELLALGE